MEPDVNFIENSVDPDQLASEFSMTHEFIIIALYRMWKTYTLL